MQYITPEAIIRENRKIIEYEKVKTHFIGCSYAHAIGSYSRLIYIPLEAVRLCHAEGSSTVGTQGACPNNRQGTMRA